MISTTLPRPNATIAVGDTIFDNARPLALIAGPCALAGAVLVAENPTDLHIFLSAFTGVRELRATSSGVSAPTPRGIIEVMDPAAFKIHFGVAPPNISEGARLAGIRFAVRDIAALQAALVAGGIVSVPHAGATVIPAEAALGANLIFGSG